MARLQNRGMGTPRRRGRTTSWKCCRPTTTACILACFTLGVALFHVRSQHAGESFAEMQLRTAAAVGSLLLVPDRSASGVAPAEAKTKNSIWSQRLQQVKAAKTRQHAHLREQYGVQVASNLVQSSADLFSPESSARNPSMSRLVRRLQVSLLQQGSNKKQWVVAVAGRAATGNLERESHAAVLQRAASSVFTAAGLSLQVRNYGMTSHLPAPELALCQESIYGTDVDLLLTDFADSQSDSWRRQMFLHRAVAATRNFRPPAVLGMYLDDSGATTTRNANSATADFDALAAAGATALGMQPRVLRRIRNQLPITNTTAAGGDFLLPLIRNLKCQAGAVLETGGGVCSEQRFSRDTCPNRLYRRDSFAGFKQQALTGHLVALFLVQQLEQAVQGLLTKFEDVGDQPGVLTTAVLAELQSAQDADDSRVRREAKIPAVPKELFHPSDYPDVKPADLFQRTALCHTARLPSEMRYRGILTDKTADDFDHFYREGMEREKADKLMANMFEDTTGAVDDANMKLVYTETLRQKHCNVTLNRDYPDCFYVGPNEGWKSLVIPSDKEREAYRIEKLRGLIIVCLVKPNLYDRGFNGQEIKAGDLHTRFGDHSVRFRVNGLPVQGITVLETCSMLKGDNGHYWEPGPTGRYEIEAMIGDQDETQRNILQISSVILM